MDNNEILIESDIVLNENDNPNSPKKRKSFEMESSDTLSSLSVSKQPKINNKQEKLVIDDIPIAKKTRSRETISITSKIPKVSTIPRISIDRKSQLKKVTTELSSSERLINTSKQVSESRIVNQTPMKEIKSNITSSTTKSNMKLHRNTPMKGSEEKIQSLFENAFSVNESQLNAIDLSIKPQKRNIFPDTGEKLKKYTLAVKDLKQMLQTQFVEIRLLKDNCISHQSLLINIINETRGDLLDAETNISTYKSNEIRLKKDILKINEDLAKSQASNNQLSRDIKDITDKSKETDFKVSNLTSKLETERTLKQHAETKVTKLEEEILHLRKEMSQSINQSKEQYEERLNEHVTNYKNEITNLKNELLKKQLDVTKSSEEKEENDRKANKLREDYFNIQSISRENENTIKRLEKENEKLVNDIILLRDQLNNKDVDLRQTLQSLSDAQRLSSEEKCDLKIEMGTLNNRILTLEEEKKHLFNDISYKKDEVNQLQKEFNELKDININLTIKLNDIETYTYKIKELSMTLEIEKELRARCEVREETERRERIAACAQLIAIQNETTNKIKEIENATNTQINNIQNELLIAVKQRDDSMMTSENHMETIVGLQSEIQQLKHALDTTTSCNNANAVEELSKVTGELEIMKRRIRETNEVKAMENSILLNKLQLLEDQLKENEVQRRKLHNTIQELRGNIRVFARIRPFLPNDNSKSIDSVITPRSDDISLKVIKKPTNEYEKLEEYTFTYDKVFGPSSSQETVFNEVSEFVQSALDGYNVCIFSYGQTGSGKTHTMQGSGTGPMRGIIPRAMEQVGLYKNTLEEKGWIYSMEISFIEIYNETIRDLLRTTHSDDIKHDIKKDANGNSYITDVTMQTVDPNNTPQLESIIELAATHRSVGQTAMNDRSSRSHSIFTLHLTAVNRIQNMTLKGSLSLVDLAGSERIDRSGVSGARLKESVAINKSLSSLTDVFVAIANKQSHVPFRNSKLTYLLQPALCGDGKTLMLVNISPTEESCQESLCSLRMASQVNQCELGKPKKSLKDSTISVTTSEKAMSIPVPPSPRTQTLTSNSIRKPIKK